MQDFLYYALRSKRGSCSGLEKKGGGRGFWNDTHGMEGIVVSDILDPDPLDSFELTIVLPNTPESNP